MVVCSIHQSITGNSTLPAFERRYRPHRIPNRGAEAENRTPLCRLRGDCIATMLHRLKIDKRSAAPRRRRRPVFLDVSQCQTAQHEKHGAAVQGRRLVSAFRSRCLGPLGFSCFGGRTVALPVNFVSLAGTRAMSPRPDFSRSVRRRSMVASAT